MVIGMKSTGRIRGFRKSFTLMLTAALALPLLLTGFGSEIGQVEAKGAANHYFYDQLTDKEKAFYDAMEYMYTEGLFKTGRENLELTEKGYLSQADLGQYADGFTDLLSQMGAARDAFYFDHADIFYVDFSALSLRVTQTSNGVYHAYLGTGRRDNYFTEGFDSKEDVDAAIAEYEKAVNAIVDEVKDMKVDPGMDLIKEQITAVHTAVIEKTKYALEDTCKPENIGFIRTAYGALVKGEGACEAYARAMKAILDRLDIPCVLVQGLYRYTEKQLELHMWNYVQLGDKWYGVDATMDDSMKNSDLLLAGDDVMGIHHVPSAVVSPANREFSYPSLSQDTKTFEEIENSNGLTVAYLSGTANGKTTSTIRVSYKGMGYQEAAKQGKYILSRFYQYYPGTGKYVYNDWAYADPTPYDIPQDEHALIFPAEHIMYAEFAVTTTPPEGIFFQDGKLDEDYWYFKGDPLLFEAQTRMIYNPNGTYVKPPYPKTYSPSIQGRIHMGQTYDMRIEYDEKLIKTGSEDVSYTLTCSGSTGSQYSKIENFHWDGDRTISFKFTPSPMFADESAVYTFQFTGLVGEDSLKEPFPMKYISDAPAPSCAYRAQGYNWNVFGQPSLLEDDDLSMSGWVTSDGENVSEKLKDRLALVVTKPSQNQSDNMNEMIQDTLKETGSGAEVLACETYNIILTLCKAQVIETGQGVRVSVGFPAGYGPDDEGVTFKAYHFKKDDSGKVIDVEEIDCVVTRFGLIITCKSFSPFAIVALEGEAESPTDDRAVILYGSYGGKISVQGKESIFTLAQNDQVSVNVTAEEGYLIESVDVGGFTQKITDPESMTLRLAYSDLQKASTIIEAKFVAKTVAEMENERNETSVELSTEDIFVPVVSRPAKPEGTQTSPSPGSSPAGSAQAPATQAPATQTQAPATAPQAQAPSASTTTAPQPSTPAVTVTPATAAPATRVPSSTGSTAKNNGNETEAPSGTATVSPGMTVGTVASVDMDTVGSDTDKDLVIAALPQAQITESNSDMYWIILPILVLAAAVGAGLYFLTDRDHSRRR